MKYIAEQFDLPGAIVDINEFGAGNINDTYLVTLDSKEQFILQRINKVVFSQPQLVMENLRIFTEHVHKRMKDLKLESPRRWEVQTIQKTKAGDDFYIDNQSDCWRVLSFIGQCRTYSHVIDSNHASEAGSALGIFHSLVSDLDHQTLHDTLKGFHITPQYLHHYDQVLKNVNKAINHSNEENYCKQFIDDRRDIADVLEDAKKQNRLSLRTMHGDPKLDNILIDDETKLAIGLIDLDTVKPGLIHYDIGDCLRSCCNPVGEETNCLDDVIFDTELCSVILNSYLKQANFLNLDDYVFLYDAIRLIPLELGIRFFADHLEGNVYFKVADDKQNLRRAMVQFKLTESIEFQETTIKAAIDKFCD